MSLSPRDIGPVAIFGIAICFLAGCTTVQIPSRETLLSEDQIVDLMRHPRRWYGRVVKVEIYPYDMGHDRSYLVCFERCDPAYAERSSWIIDTGADRFKDYRGDRPAVVTARFESNCARLPAPGHGGRLVDFCPDLITGRFTEVD